MLNTNSSNLKKLRFIIHTHQWNVPCKAHVDNEELMGLINKNKKSSTQNDPLAPKYFNTIILHR